MATFNGEKYIIKQLQSLFTQYRLPDEIIIVDDYSTDSTLELINNYFIENKSSINVTIIQNDKNLGVVNTFKRALNLSSGELLFLCDQDDIFEKQKIKIAEEFFQKRKDIKIFISGYRLIDENEKFLSKKRWRGKNKLLKIDDLLKGNQFPGCTIAFRAELKSFFNLMNDAVFIHDWFLLLLSIIYYPKSIYFYSKPLVNYRIHSSNALGINYKNEVKFSLSERIEGIEKTIHLLEQVQFHSQERIKNNSIKNKIRDQIIFNKSRIAFLKRQAGFLYLAFNVSKYLNWKMFLGDIIYKVKRNGKR